MTDKQQPEALRLAVASNAMADEGEMIHLLSWHEIRNLLRADAAELRRLHAYCQELEAQVILDCMTHVQNPAEIEHVAGVVSKNGAELNMTGSAMRASHGQAPAQAAPVCGSPADLPPLPDPDLRDVGTTPRDIKEFLRGYATEYALTALTARAPADSVQDLQPVHDAVTIDLLNERVAYLERKLQEADSVLEDAARYRWLRQHDGVDCTDDGEFIAGALSGITIGIDASRAQGIDGADLDTAIDAARAAQEGK